MLPTYIIFYHGFSNIDMLPLNLFVLVICLFKVVCSKFNKIKLWSLRDCDIHEAFKDMNHGFRVMLIMCGDPLTCVYLMVGM